jgi:hypothetical protein
MSRLVKKQRKFIETLLVAGSLLAVFLAVITQSTTITVTTAPITSTIIRNSTTATVTANSTVAIHVGTAVTAYTQLVVYFGVMFTTALILIYSIFLFRDRPWGRPEGSWSKLPLGIFIAILGISFAALIFFLFVFAFTGYAHGNYDEALLVTLVLFALVFVVYGRIIQVLRREDPAEPEAEPELEHEPPPSQIGPSMPIGPPLPDPSPYQALPPVLDTRNGHPDYWTVYIYVHK